MRKFRSTIGFSAILLALSLVTAGSVSAQNTGSRSIEQQVRKTILSLPNYGVFDIIKYDVDGSRVTLTGKVYSLGTHSLAVRSARKISGVTEVIDNIENLPASPFDDRIRRQALRTFHERGLGRYFWEINPDVRIIVDGGRLTFEGYVYNSGDRNALGIYARGLSNVFEVTNNLIVGKAVY